MVDAGELDKTLEVLLSPKEKRTIQDRLFYIFEVGALTEEVSLGDINVEYRSESSLLTLRLPQQDHND